MIHAQNSKVLFSLDTSTTASSGTANLVIDRLDYDYADVVVARASNSATTFASVLKVQESDDNSTYTDITAFVGGGTGGFTIPTVTDTTSVSAVKIGIDCRNRKRYLKVLVTPSTAVNVAIEARLSRGHIGPSSATAAGVLSIVNG
jgi:hypothetical protein